MSERAERYFARLDAHLASLPDDDARMELLEAQREKFEWEYGRFLRAIGREGEEGLGEERSEQISLSGPDAFDYVLTIAGLSERINRLRAP